jgi:hypothetical protein
MRALAAGTETGPLGDTYPGWTLIHFVSALTFAVLAVFQLVPIVRHCYPSAHGIARRIAVCAGLATALSGATIPIALAIRPLLWRSYIVLQGTVMFVPKIGTPVTYSGNGTTGVYNVGFTIEQVQGSD